MAVAAATARCGTSGTPNPAAALPMAPPTTAPMLHVACIELRIERP